LPVVEWFMHHLADEAASEVFKAATRGTPDKLSDGELDAVLARAHEQVVAQGQPLLDALQERVRRVLVEIATVFAAFDRYVRDDLGISPEVAHRALLAPTNRPPESLMEVEVDESSEAVLLAVLRREVSTDELAHLFDGPEPGP